MSTEMPTKVEAFSVENAPEHQRVPTKTPTRVITGNYPVLTKMYTKATSWLKPLKPSRLESKPLKPSRLES